MTKFGAFIRATPKAAFALYGSDKDIRFSQKIKEF
jgi:hypothetical protein